MKRGRDETSKSFIPLEPPRIRRSQTSIDYSRSMNDDNFEFGMFTDSSSLASSILSSSTRSGSLFSEREALPSSNVLSDEYSNERDGAHSQLLLNAPFSPIPLTDKEGGAHAILASPSLHPLLFGNDTTAVTNNKNNVEVNLASLKSPNRKPNAVVNVHQNNCRLRRSKSWHEKSPCTQPLIPVEDLTKSSKNLKFESDDEYGDVHPKKRLRPSEASSSALFNHIDTDGIEDGLSQISVKDGERTNNNNSQATRSSSSQQVASSTLMRVEDTTAYKPQSTNNDSQNTVVNDENDEEDDGDDDDKVVDLNNSYTYENRANLMLASTKQRNMAPPPINLPQSALNTTSSGGGSARSIAPSGKSLGFGTFCTPTRQVQDEELEHEVARIDFNDFLQQCKENVKLVVLDLDMTLLTIHTKGELSHSVRPVFRKLIPLVLAGKVLLGVATFSPQEELIAEMLVCLFPGEVQINQNCFIKGEASSIDDSGKRNHLMDILNRASAALGEPISPDQTLFIDDDSSNCQNAKKAGFRVVEFKHSLAIHPKIFLNNCKLACHSD